MPSTAPPTAKRRRLSLQPQTFHTLGTAIAFGLLVGLVILALARPDAVVTTTGAAAPGASHAAVDTGPATFEIELGDIYVKPNAINVAAGSKVILKVTNKGALDHNLSLEGKEPTTVAPGASKTLEWGPFTESTQAGAPLPGTRTPGCC